MEVYTENRGYVSIKRYFCGNNKHYLESYPKISNRGKKWTFHRILKRLKVFLPGLNYSIIIIYNKSDNVRKHKTFRIIKRCPEEKRVLGLWTSTVETIASHANDSVYLGGLFDSEELLTYVKDVLKSTDQQKNLFIRYKKLF